MDEILGRFGYDLQAFGLPLPATAASAKQASKELRRELEFDRDFETNRAETMRQMMRQSPEQAGAYDAIVNLVSSGNIEGHPVSLVFLTKGFRVCVVLCGRARA